MKISSQLGVPCILQIAAGRQWTCEERVISLCMGCSNFDYEVLVTDINSEAILGVGIMSIYGFVDDYENTSSVLTKRGSVIWSSVSEMSTDLIAVATITHNFEEIIIIRVDLDDRGNLRSHCSVFPFFFTILASSHQGTVSKTVLPKSYPHLYYILEIYSCKYFNHLTNCLLDSWISALL